MSIVASGGVALGEGGEFDRVRDIIAALGDSAGPIGSDVAPIPPGSGTLVVSTDASIEHQHFRREWLSAEEIGWRATASALSDLAAAGARATGIVVALGVPPYAASPEVASVMRGAGACAQSVDAKVLGGDLTRASEWMVTVTVFGYAPIPLSRAGARPGDTLWVTGALGGARAALVSWNSRSIPTPPARDAFARPVPRISVGHWLAAHGATAMMDVSDGLAGDAPHLAAASAVALRIDLNRLPLHPSVTNLPGREAPALFAAVGGEDYELLVTLPGDWDRAGECEAATGVALTRIGAVAAGAGAVTIFDGLPVDLTGFRHHL